MTLIAHWPLQEDSGGTAYDVRGSNDGTVNGATQGATGLLGTSAYSFDGTDDSVDTGMSLSNIGSGDFAITAWYNTDTTDYSSSGANEGEIFASYPSGNLIFGIESGGYRFWVNGDDLNPGSLSSVTANEWHFAVAQRKNGTQEIYTDTNLDASQNSSSDPSGGTSYIGSRSDDRSYFDGRISDVRIYDRALTASEIQYLYNVVASPSKVVTSTKTP